ncbi:MAG TPA: hypothetical protein VM286_07225 [Candidatus Thermoplasmatota archaeon]|nr:hypothetical protein [Candidatus Thermoplasmatota archaeon]
MSVAPTHKARRHATVAMTALIAAGFALNYGAARVAFGGLLAWAVLALLLYALVACSAWAVAAWRDRRPDPWAYDPELDGPIAQEIEGRTFPPPRR